MEFKVKFSWEGFAHLDRDMFIDALSQNGYSKTEVRRLLQEDAIKIRATKITADGNHWQWYKKTISFPELIEPNDIIFIGKYGRLTIKAIPFAWHALLYYRGRDILDRFRDIKFKGKYVFGDYLKVLRLIDGDKLDNFKE